MSFQRRDPFFRYNKFLLGAEDAKDNGRFVWKQPDLVDDEYVLYPEIYILYYIIGVRYI